MTMTAEKTMLDHQIKSLNDEFLRLQMSSFDLCERATKAKAELDQVTTRMQYLTERVNDLISIRESIRQAEEHKAV